MGEQRIPKKVINWTPIDRNKRRSPKSTRFGNSQKAMLEINLFLGDWADRRRG